MRLLRSSPGCLLVFKFEMRRCLNMKQMQELSQQMNLKMNMHMPICSTYKTGHALPVQPRVFSLLL